MAKVTCAGCGEEFESEDALYLECDNKWYCRECARDVVLECVSCGGKHTALYFITSGGICLDAEIEDKKKALSKNLGKEANYRMLLETTRMMGGAPALDDFYEVLVNTLNENITLCKEGIENLRRIKMLIGELAGGVK